MYYKDLEVWKEAMKLVTEVYKLTENYPKSEIFGLTNQIRRSVVSIPSNIAEGIVRYSDKDTLRFLDIAFGSLAELETQLLISQNLGYILEVDLINEQISRVNALLLGLIKFYKKQLKDMP